MSGHMPGGEAERLDAAIAELKAAIGRSWIRRLLLRLADGVVWLDRALRRT